MYVLLALPLACTYRKFCEPFGKDEVEYCANVEEGSTDDHYPVRKPIEASSLERYCQLRDIGAVWALREAFSLTANRQLER